MRNRTQACRRRVIGVNHLAIQVTAGRYSWIDGLLVAQYSLITVTVQLMIVSLIARP